MSWWTRWRQSRSKQVGNAKAEMGKDENELYIDVRRAHKNWENAYRYFNYATDPDEIECAIYALEAAEKRYEMLLRQAKRHHLAVTVKSDVAAGGER